MDITQSLKDTLPSPLANKKIILENCVFVPSYDCGESKSDSSIYFYHFGKTGGTTVGSFLRGLAYANDQSLLHLQDLFYQRSLSHLLLVSLKIVYQR